MDPVADAGATAWPLLLAALAACGIGTGAALQQQAAHGASSPGRAGIGLIAVLLRRPVWVVGVLVMVLGFGLQAAALDLGRLSVVEPILATGLVVALLVSAVRRRSSPRPRDWVAMLLTSGGVAAFLVLAAPSGGREQPSLAWWPPVLALLAVGGGGVVWRAARWPASRAAMGMAAVAGVTLGVSDALVKTTLAAAAQLGPAVLATFVPYMLVVVGAAGFVLQQHAYRIGELRAALPAASVLEPVTGTVLGLVLFGERTAAAGAGARTALVLAAATAAAGVWRLGTAPLLADSAEPARPARPAAPEPR